MSHVISQSNWSLQAFLWSRLVEILLVILALVAFLFLFFRLLLWYATKVTTIAVDRRHHDAERILTTGRIPPNWVASDDARHRRQALRRMGALMRYMRRTTLVDGEDTREVILTQLDEMKERWEDAPWSEIGPEEAR
jgi:hypothetical protein